MTNPAEWMRIGRPIDPKLGPHRLILAIMAVTFVAMSARGLIDSLPLADSALVGLDATLDVFLCWALARELDPDRPHSAFPGTFLLLAVMLWQWTTPSIASSFWLLLTLRVANRTTGYASTWLDTAVVLGLTAWGVRAGYAAAPWIAGLALAADGLCRTPLRRHLVIGITLPPVLALIADQTNFVAHQHGSDLPGAPWLIGLGIVTLGFAGRSITLPTPVSKADNGSETLDAQRVGSARLLAFLAAWSFSIATGQAGLVALLPVTCAMAGVTMWPRSR